MKIIEKNLFVHDDSFTAALIKAEKDQLVERIWAGDYTLWAKSDIEISNRLGWLDIAKRMKADVSRLSKFVDEIKSEGISKVLILGMGGSSLAPEVFSKIFNSATGFPDLSILDSTDPESIRAKIVAFEPEKTLYIVSTKSGGTVETLSFFKLFYNLCVEDLGSEKAGSHFVAITDPNSKLAELAKKHSFRKIFLNDPNIGGRYSALSYFGLLPAALLGMDLNRLLDEALAMAEACRSNNLGENPGVILGISMGVLAKERVDKLTFVSEKNIAPFGDWAEQLIAESTGKSGKGILPLVNRSITPETRFSQDHLYILFGDTKQKSIEYLLENEVPHISLEWKNRYSIGAQIFLWEFATAVASHIIKVHPFNQPNVESAKIAAKSMVEVFISEGKLPDTDYTPISSGAINSLIENAKSGAYVSLHAYAEANEQSRFFMEELQVLIESKHGLSTSIGFGPRFLHSTGQLHKGDNGKGIFIQFVNDVSKKDLAIPLQAGESNSQISFDTLKHAQAAGDAAALKETGRKIISFDIPGDFSLALENLIDEMSA